jgi:hypothetical protein
MFYVKSAKAPPSNQATKTINFEKFAKHWNEHVNSIYNGNFATKVDQAEGLYYKILELLERHHKVWAALRAENATVQHCSTVKLTVRLSPLFSLIHFERQRCLILFHSPLKRHR